MYKVMIVEDEMFVRIGLEHSIAWEMYEMEVVAVASNGIEAYEQYEKWKPHLIITDIKMPKMDGVELITKIRQQDKTVRFIILTCMEDFKTAKSAVNNAVSYYFVKADMSMNAINEAVKSIYRELQRDPVIYSENNLPVSDKSEELLQYVTSDEKTIINHNLLDFWKYKDVTYVLAELYIRNFKVEGSIGTQQRHYESVIDVIEELLKKQRSGKLLFTQKDRVYLLLYKKAENSLEDISESLAYITSMIYSYFNLKASALTGHEFSQISQLKAQYQELTANNFVLFYLTDAVKIMVDESLVSACTGIVKTGMQQVTAFYRENFDCEYAQEFCEYGKLLNASVITDVNGCRQFFSQWFQLFNAIMHISGEEMKQNQTKVLNHINNSQSFPDIIEYIMEFMKHYKSNEESRRQMSVGLIKAINYIHQNIDKPLSLPLVAENVNFSAGYLSYLFTNELNMSFTNFILNVRIKTAKIMLTQTDDKLYVIAESIGFKDQGYFNKVFKKCTGMTPGLYRKQNYKHLNIS